MLQKARENTDRPVLLWKPSSVRSVGQPAHSSWYYDFFCVQNDMSSLRIHFASDKEQATGETQEAFLS